jgi:hypothetical protein
VVHARRAHRAAARWLVAGGVFRACLHSLSTCPSRGAQSAMHIGPIVGCAHAVVRMDSGSTDAPRSALCPAANGSAGRRSRHWSRMGTRCGCPCLSGCQSSFTRPLRATRVMTHYGGKLYARRRRQACLPYPLSLARWRTNASGVSLLIALHRSPPASRVQRTTIHRTHHSGRMPSGERGWPRGRCRLLCRCARSARASCKAQGTPWIALWMRSARPWTASSADTPRCQRMASTRHHPGAQAITSLLPR